MTPLFARYRRLVGGLDAASPWAIPTLARFVFVAVLFVYFWNSAGTKLTGPFTPSFGAFSQIFPRAAEAASYNLAAASLFQKTVMVLAAWAEYALPLLIAVGFLTRFAALGMIGFVIVQSLTDIHGHGLGPTDIGAWFDHVATAVIMDQRMLWVFVLLVLVLRGSGPLAVDGAIRFLWRRPAPASPA
jgi:putative oxidoreductase